MILYCKFKNSKNEWLEHTSKEGALTFTLDFNKSYTLDVDLDSVSQIEDIANPVFSIAEDILMNGKQKMLYIYFFNDKAINDPLAEYVLKISTITDVPLNLNIPNPIDSQLKNILVSLRDALSGKIIDFIFKESTSSALSDIYDTLGIPTGKPRINKESSEDEIINYINNKTKATVSKPKETIDDYVCNKTLKQELLEICDFFSNEKLYKDKNVIIPKGILFKGEPGTGKTYAAKCIAGSAECYFLHTTASALQGQYIGSGAENIKTLFKAARMLKEKTNKGIIIFIDELDSLGSRDSHSGNAGGEEDRTLNQLLAELSGFEDDENIMVMAATNYPDRLDNALMRSGRFSRQINIDYPNETERYNLVKYYFNKINMKLIDTNYNEIAFLTDGISPADIKEVANEAAILAIRSKKDDICLENVNEAINKIITKNIRNEDSCLDLNLVAAHESGHVLAELLLAKTVPIKVTNYSYGNTGGFTQSGKPLEVLQTKDDLINKIKILLGGRAAEKIIFNKETTGASNDIYKAKNILKKYYELYLFDTYDSEKINQLIIDELLKYYNDVLNLFELNKEMLQTLTNNLISQRVLYKNDIITIYTSNGGIL